MRARLLFLAARLYWWLFKPITIGVRMLMIRREQILLVKHTYQPDWYLPGGGVKRNETLEDCARREAWEEVGATLGEVRLFGVYSNLNRSASDHIVVFLCQKFELTTRTNFEIAQLEFFPLDALPKDVSTGSARRVLQYQAGVSQPATGDW